MRDRRHRSVRPLRVLLVEDSPANQGVAVGFLQRWGHSVVVADNGREALAALARERFDLVLMDVQMPEMDGFQATAAIREWERASGGHIPIIAVTANAMKGDRERCLEAGMDGYVAKPIDSRELFEMIEGIGAPSASPPAAGLPPAAPASPRARVLVVEDNAVNQQVAVRMVERRGHRADVVANGLEAVEALARIPYDLVLMDCQMPEMDGFEATVAIRAREGSRGHTPIIAMTANAMKGDRERCLAAGMDDYISKPVRAKELDTVLRRWLHEPRAEGSVLEGALEDDGVVFDRGEALTRADDDEDLLRSLIGLFWEACPGLVAEIRAAVARRESAAWARAAHSLKGSASQIGAYRVAEVSAKLEERGRAGSADEAEALVAQLETDVERLCARLRAEGLLA